MDDCPTLIGIRQHGSKERNHFSPFEHHTLVLSRCDLWLQTNNTSTVNTVLQKLSAFRQNWQRNYQFLFPFDFNQSTGMLPDILIEIKKYLSLNEAINAFSISILSLLRQTHSKIHLNNPSEQFLKMIHRYVDRRQIASLHITDGLLELEHRCLVWASIMLDHPINLTVVIRREAGNVRHLLSILPKAHRLSLWFEGTISSFLLKKIQQPGRYPITWLYIRCADVPSERPWRETGDDYPKNTTITSFILDSAYFPTHLDKHNYQRNRRQRHTDFAKLVMKSIGSLINIQRVRLITRQSEIEYFLTRLGMERPDQ